MKTNQERSFIWKISGSGLPDLRVKADCFDNALAEAREINSNYSSGQVIVEIKTEAAVSRERGKSMEKTLREMVEDIDKVNAEYILRDERIGNEYKRLKRFQRDGREDVIKFQMDRLVEMIREFDGTHLTPANAKVGDGATIRLWSDNHACTIIKVTKSSITVQRDKATLHPDFKPEFEMGGFLAYCTNQSEQSYTYERDEQGQVTTLRWSDKYQSYGRPGSQRLIKGRHEFYDYNF